MITVQEALDIILSKTRDFGTETIELSNALGRLLAHDIVADRDYPPFDRVTMDGIAIDYESYEKGARTFLIEGVAAAGSSFATLDDNQHCIEVMTGAGVPHGCNTVIRYEDLTIDEEQRIATISDGVNIKAKQNVHFQGSDKKAGTMILKKGMALRPAEIGIAASLGCSNLKVHAIPKLAIISTGDELVDITVKPLPYQIRKSNVYTIQSILRTYGINASLYHLIDDQTVIADTVEKLLASYDVLILSGGVSKGKFDFIPRVMDELGVVTAFHKIKQRPGKPFWFGYTDNNIVFALPGNPVSSFVCTKKYIESWLRQSLGIQPKQAYAILNEKVEFNPDLHYFLEVGISYTNDGRLLAHPQKSNGSGDFVNLTRAQAFIELPRGKNRFESGECYPIIFI